MGREIVKDSTNQTVYFHLRKTVDGTDQIGLVFNSAGAICSYIRNSGLRVAITLVTLAAADSAHSDGGFKEVDGTNAKGLYRLDITDAAVATGVNSVIIYIGFDNTFSESLEISLVDNTKKDIYDIVNTTGVVVAVASKTGYALSTVGIKAIWDQLTSVLTTVGSIGKKLTDWVLGTDNKAILSSDAHTGAVIPNVTLVGTTTTNTDMVSEPPTAVQNRQEMDSNSTQLAAIKAKTDNMPSGFKKNTAFTNFEFKMIDSTDNKTGKIGLAVTAQRSIDGAAFAPCANSPSEIGLGSYKIDFAASDLNGDMSNFIFTATGANATDIIIKTNT